MKKLLLYSLLLLTGVVVHEVVQAQQAKVFPRDKDINEEFEKSNGDFARQRVEYRYKLRASEDGKIPFGALLKAKRQVDVMRAQKQKQPMDAGIWNWEWLGPGNVGGRIRSILIHPTSPSTMWIGAVSGGIWRTDNGGASWSPVDDFMATLAVGSMVMDPTDPLVMYAGTGEGFFNIDALPGAGIFKTVNGGLTWIQLPSTNDTNFLNVNRLAHHPTIPGRLYCVTTMPNGSGEIRWTTNGGTTWPRLATTYYAATDIKIHPQHPNRLAVGTSVPVTGGSVGDVLLSYDGGVNWIKQTDNSSNKLPWSPGRCEVHFGNGDTVYASIDDNGTEIWRSVDSGATWSRRSTGSGYLGGQGWYNNVLWVSPHNSNFLLLGGVGLGRSTDGGATFTDMKPFHADQHSIVSHPGYNGTTNRYIYVGGDGGIGWAYDTTSVSAGWTLLNNNLGITQFYGGAAHPSGSVIAGGTQDNDKVHFMPRFGTGNWYVGPSYNSTWGDGGTTAIDQNNAARMYGEYPGLGFQRSDDSGRHYYRKTSGMTDGYSSDGAWVAPFLIDPNASNILIAGGRTVWRTRDYAESWYSIRSPLPSYAYVLAIDIALGNSARIWVGYGNGTVSTTSDTGGTWTDVDNNSPPLPNRSVTDIAVNPANENDAIVTFGGYQDSSIWRTTDGGANWTCIEGTGTYKLPEIQINTVRFHPLSSNWIYIGTDLGVFASEDGGATWSTHPFSSKNEGPVNVEIDELFWQASDKLIAATHGRGMFRCRPLPVVYVDQNNSGPEDGTWLYPYNTVNEALEVAGAGTIISVMGNTYYNAPLRFDRRATIQPNGVVIIR